MDFNIRFFGSHKSIEISIPNSIVYDNIIIFY